MAQQLQQEPFTGNNYYNNNGLSVADGGFTTIPDQIGNALGCGTVGQPIRSNIMHKEISKILPPYSVNPSLHSPS